jgi:hypothetical protein
VIKTVRIEEEDFPKGSAAPTSSSQLSASWEIRLARSSLYVVPLLPAMAGGS